MPGRKPARAPGDPLCKNRGALRPGGWRPAIGDVVAVNTYALAPDTIAIVLGTDSDALAFPLWVIHTACGKRRHVTAQELRPIRRANGQDD